MPLPKLPVVTGAEVVRALKRGGFVVDRQSGSHVLLRHPQRRYRIPVPVHSGRDMAPGTLRTIIRGAGLTVEDFIRLLK